MEILKTSKPAFTAKELYVLTMSPEVQKMSDAKTQRLEVDTYCLYGDTDKDNKPQQILAIASPEGDVHATNSPTFIEDFFRMQDMFAGCGEIVTAIKVISGTSKGGREFITCAYAD